MEQTREYVEDAVNRNQTGGAEDVQGCHIVHSGAREGIGGSISSNARSSLTKNSGTGGNWD